MINKTYFKALILLLLTLFSFACKKEYYTDSGLQKGIFSTSSLSVLQEKPFFFDSLVTVIQLAGIEDIIKDSTVTFFAPTNNALRQAMNALNARRYNNFEDSLKLQDVPSIVWRKFLTRYIFRGRYMLKDITRWDISQLGVYPGMNLESFDGYIMNIGVQFSDYNGTKDVGPRTVFITAIGDLSNPENTSAAVASSDLQTNNGIIHIINSNHVFGFNQDDFVNVVESYIK